MFPASESWHNKNDQFGTPDDTAVKFANEGAYVWHLFPLLDLDIPSEGN